MKDIERKKFMHDIRVEESPEFDEKRELKKYQKFVNSSDFDNFKKVEVSPYSGDTER